MECTLTEMITPEIREMLARAGLSPNKLLGQNFLVDQNILKKIVTAADPKPDETILEVGPGLGSLTNLLSETDASITAIEKDPKIARVLENEIAKRRDKNIELVIGDILKISDNFFLNLGKYRVIANIPYYLTARLLRKLLEEVNPPKEIIVMIQKEVAERILAKPPHMNLLALATQTYGAPRILFPVSKGAFWPVPEVDSAVLKIENISKDFFKTNKVDEKLFFKLLKSAFATKRKTLVNSLEREFQIKKEDARMILGGLELKETARPEELGLPDWVSLIHMMKREVVD